MKKILTLLISAAAAVACGKSASLPEVQFEQVFYNVCSRSAVPVKLILSEPAGGDLAVPVSFSGTAVKDVDYKAVAAQAVFREGSREASLDIVDLGLAENQTVSISIVGGRDYSIGTKHTCVVALDAEEKLVYDFSAKSVDLYEKASVTLTVRGVVSGTAFRAPADLNVPFTLDGKAAGAVAASAGSFVIPKGGNSATVEFTVADGSGVGEFENDEKVEVVIGGTRFVKGDAGSAVIVVKSGLQLPSRLVGKWVYDHTFSSEELQSWFEEMEDDVSLLPLDNEGFTLEIAEDAETGAVTLSPSSRSGFGAFYRTATLDMTAPLNMFSSSVLLGKFTASEYDSWYVEESGDSAPAVYTYYTLSSANRSFDNSRESIGSAVIAARLVDKDHLIIVLHDYDKPPFGENWWSSSFDPDMFGFSSLFTRR